MIHKNQSKRNNQFKYLLLVPVLFAFIMTFNTKVIAQEKNEWVSKSETIELIITKESTDFSLEKESALFKEKFDINLSFKGVKRNSKNEITAIKIEAKGESLKTKFENAGSEPIKPIKISFNSESNSVSIGNVNKTDENHFTYKINIDDDAELKGKTNKDGNYVFVNSEDKQTSFTIKGSDTIIVENKVIIKKSSDKEHIWISKETADGKTITTYNETISPVPPVPPTIDIDIPEDEVEIEEIDIEFSDEDDNADKNVFIIKKDGDNAIENKSSNHMFISSDDEKSPLIIIDGKEVKKEEMKNTKPDDIESINVLKGDSATKKYGEKGANGVIEIKLKKN